MRIATNVSALNSWRNLTMNEGRLSKTLEKLSSGYRINRAADDAAGLAISEKMRAQITGLNMAVKNSQDGISLIQTAEGALNEYHAILQRMRELSIQASNRIQTNDDISAMQDELNQLMEEANRIANTTEFNKQKLFDGAFVGKQLQIGANAGQVLAFGIEDMRTSAVGATWGEGTSVDEAGLAALAGDLTVNGVTIDASGATSIREVLDAINAQSGVTGVTATQVEQTVFDAGAFAAPGTDTTLTINGKQFAVLTTDTLNDLVERINLASSETGVAASAQGGNLVLTEGAGSPIEITAGDAAILGNVADTTAHTYVAALRLVTDPGGAITVGGTTDPGVLGLGAWSTSDNTVNQVTVDTLANATQSIVTLDYAITQVSKQRSLLGALQNRLEHTINNLQVASENLSAAESRIRDVDMAAEMANFTKQQILLQAGTAMLAQANAAPQSVLQLLG